MSWTVSPILQPLIDQVRGKHPGMVIGTIGDVAHQNEISDHNPDAWGFVCAADFMIGPHFTAADAEDLFRRLRIIKDSRTRYVIYNRRIFYGPELGNAAWVNQTYTGSDPHTNHIHVSVIHRSNPRPTTSWDIYPSPVEQETDMTEAQFKDWFITTLSEIGNAALPDGDPNKIPTTQIGRNGLVYIQRILDGLTPPPVA